MCLSMSLVTNSFYSCKYEVKETVHKTLPFNPSIVHFVSSALKYLLEAKLDHIVDQISLTYNKRYCRLFSEEKLNKSVTIVIITWGSLLYKMYRINPSNPDTLFYCFLNIQIHARLQVQETAPRTFKSIQSTYRSALLCN